MALIQIWKFGDQSIRTAIEGIFNFAILRAIHSASKIESPSEHAFGSAIPLLISSMAN